MKSCSSTLIALALGAAACAPPHPEIAHPPDAEIKPADQKQQETPLGLQGDVSAWGENPHIHAFYELTKARLENDREAFVFNSYRDDAFEIFRRFGPSMGMSAEAMVDHLKDIPRQMVEIVKDDPAVLDDFAGFREALMGPD